MAILPALVVFGLSSQAADLREDPVFAPEGVEITLPGRVMLESISPRELLHGGTGVAATIAGQIESLVYGQPARVMREIPVLWEASVPPQTRPEEVRVELRLDSNDGATTRLTHEADGGSEIRVAMIPTPPRIVGRSQTGLILQGGARIEMNVGSVQRAGQFDGVITVRLEIP